MNTSKMIIFVKLCISLFLVQGYAAFSETIEHIEQAAQPPYTPTQDFPGYFDTNVMPAHKLSLDLPSVQMIAPPWIDFSFIF